jgi:hypothetical protein
VTRAAAEAVEGALEEPIFIRSGLLTAAGRANNGNFVQWENALTKGVFTITLTKRGTRRDGHTGQEMERILSKEWGKLLALFPNLVFMIAEDDDARFRLEWVKILILLDGKNAHCGNGPRSALLPKSAIFSESDLLVGVELLDALLFLKEAL